MSRRVFRQIGHAVPERAMSLLDLGAGTGQFTLQFGSRFERAVLVDHSVGMLSEAKRNTESRRTRVEFHHGDALDYLSSMKRKFDVIASVGFQHHLDASSLHRLLQSIRHALTSHGVLVIAEPVETATREPGAARFWNRPGVARLRKYLELVPFPDEAPVDLKRLRAIIEHAGLVSVYERRARDLLSRHGGTLIDRVFIHLLDGLLGAGGCVWFAVLKPARHA